MHRGIASDIRLGRRSVDIRAQIQRLSELLKARNSKSSRRRHSPALPLLPPPPPAHTKTRAALVEPTPCASPLRVSLDWPRRGGVRRGEGEETFNLSHSRQVNVLVVSRHELRRRPYNSRSIGAVDSGQRVCQDIRRTRQRTCLALSFFCAIKCSSARWSVKILNLAPSNEDNSEDRGGSGGIIQDGSLLSACYGLATDLLKALDVGKGRGHLAYSASSASTSGARSDHPRNGAGHFDGRYDSERRQWSFGRVETNLITIHIRRLGAQRGHSVAANRTNANLRIISYSEILQLYLTDVREPLAAITTLIGFAKRQRAGVQQCSAGQFGQS
ncbi:hypothetical protein MKEN_00109300 [Mycena kentingensis (nom. inval.)]|nr:hypothetical protein MKEN_00109300 [Mycena kentingensis (nom. inval.)]